MKELIERSKVKKEDTWDLSSLYASNEAWEVDLKKYSTYEEKFLKLKGSLKTGVDAVLSFCLLDTELGLLDEKLGYYAFLRMSEDAGDSARQDMQNRYSSVSVKLQAATSFFAPELLGLDDDYHKLLLSDPKLADFHISLEKILRTKAHILSEAEENILALQEDAFQTPDKVFTALTDVDFDFGSIETPEGKIPLSHGSYASLQQHKDRELREKSYKQYYDQFEKHKNTIANLYIGSIKQDVFKARVRKHKSSVERSLFPDKIPLAVYENLVSEVRKGLPILHRYYDIRARAQKLQKLELWDTKTSLVPGVEHSMSYDEAANLVLDALNPLGKDYVDTLRQGFFDGWVDKFENKGKDSGAFSAGCYTGKPYILMNYKNDLLRDVFTLAHEAGHSMHSYYSVRSNHFSHYRYTIFEAEIASTCNEQLLFAHWYKSLPRGPKSLYLVNKQIDDILATLFRQTMFAEYELTCHRIMEESGALSIESLRREYRGLLEAYFGSAVNINNLADLEGLRIPHFYRAFYVYKYATGISAAIALSRGILENKPNALESYHKFLQAGGRYYPLENVAQAGVDMSRPEPIQKAIGYFNSLLDELEAGLFA